MRRCTYRRIGFFLVLLSAKVCHIFKWIYSNFMRGKKFNLPWILYVHVWKIIYYVRIIQFSVAAGVPKRSVVCVYFSFFLLPIRGIFTANLFNKLFRIFHFSKYIHVFSFFICAIFSCKKNEEISFVCCWSHYVKKAEVCVLMFKLVPIPIYALFFLNK